MAAVRGGALGSRIGSFPAPDIRAGEMGGRGCAVERDDAQRPAPTGKTDTADGRGVVSSRHGHMGAGNGASLGNVHMRSSVCRRLPVRVDRT